MENANVSSAIGALRAELVKVERQLADYEVLRERRKRLLDAIEAAESVEALGKPMPTTVEDIRKSVLHYLARHMPSAQPDTPSEAAVEILRQLGRAVHVRELINLIQGRGWFADRSYESLRGTIAGTLDARANRGEGILKPEPATYLWDPTPIPRAVSVAGDPIQEELRHNGPWRVTPGLPRPHEG